MIEARDNRKEAITREGTSFCAFRIKIEAVETDMIAITNVTICACLEIIFLLILHNLARTTKVIKLNYNKSNLTGGNHAI